MKLIVVIIGIVAVGAIAAGAGCIQTSGDPIEAVPSGVDVVGIAYWDKMISDSDVQALMDKYIKAMGEGEYSSFDEAYADFKGEAGDKTGIDPSEISTVVFFAKIPEDMRYYGASTPGYFGLVIEGNLDKAKIIDKIKEEQGEEIKEETHNGVVVSIIAPGQDPEGAIAELDNLLLFGTKDAVFDSIDAKKDGKKLTGELKDTFESVKGNFVKVAGEIPEEIRKQMEEAPAGGAPIDVSVFGNIEYVAYGLNKEGGKFSQQVRIITTDKSSAKDITDVIDGAGTMYKGMAPEELKEVLERYEVTQSGTTVKIDSEMTVKEIEETIETIAELSESSLYGGL